MSKLQNKSSEPLMFMGYTFKTRELLEEALTHKSYFNEHQDEGVKYNERLEFLGDSVLGLIISDLLMDKFMETPEGVLSRYRSELVNEKRLAEISRSVNLGEFIRFGKGERESKGGTKDSILASTLEAVIGSIYCDGGFKSAYKLVKGLFEPLLNELEKDTFSRDFKTKLQKYTQSTYKVKPVYRVSNESGPDHDKIFEVEILISGEVKATGTGNSKKQAEQNAAENLLEEVAKEDA